MCTQYLLSQKVFHEDVPNNEVYSEIDTSANLSEEEAHYAPSDVATNSDVKSVLQFKDENMAIISVEEDVYMMMEEGK